MDRATRDHYRKVVEELALAAGQSEWSVAAAGIDLAQTAIQTLPAPPPAGDADAKWAGLSLPRDAHVGYYLLDRGRTLLEQQLDYRPGPAARLASWAGKHPTRLYLTPILLLSALLVAGAAAYAYWQGGALWQALLAGLLAVLPAISVAVAVFDWALTLVDTPHACCPSFILLRMEAPGASRTHAAR